MSKIPIYFVPGLAADKKIFEYMNLSSELFDFYFLDWNIPTSLEEPLEDYAQRMCDKITHKNPVLIGVSFGGVMAQEMSKHIATKKVVIVSSIKTKNELPNHLKLAQKTKAYKLFPTKVVENIEDYDALFFTDFLKKKSKLYKKYLCIRDATYLKWGIHNVLNWQQKEPLNNIIHIHGNKDNIFPFKNIENPIEINNGSHAMIVDKARRISKIIQESIISN